MPNESSNANLLAPARSTTEATHKHVGLSVAYRTTDSLKPYERNARTHSKQQIRKLRDSITAFGFVNPVLVTSEGMIIAGHGRVQAAKLLQMEQVPTICLDRLTPDEVRAYILADNRIALDAGFSPELLKIEMLYLSSLPEFEIGLTGFDIPEIDLILASPKSTNDPADAIPALGETAVTQPNDLWLLGDHRIYCGDARQADSFRILMQEQKASMVFTDPPFNVAIDGHAGGNGRLHHREFAMAAGEMTENEFTDFLTNTLGHLVRSSKEGAVHFVAQDWRHMSELLEAGRRVYTSLLNLCVWSKGTGGMGSFYRSQHELFFVFKAGKGSHRNNVQLGKFGRYRTNVWDYPGANTASRKHGEENLLALHPTVKPVALVADALLDCSARGEIVADAFLGSGTTLLAAERTRRVCYGMEIDPLYVDLAIRRWQALTGEHAVHAATGHRFTSRSEEEVPHG